MQNMYHLICKDMQSNLFLTKGICCPIAANTPPCSNSCSSRVYYALVRFYRRLTVGSPSDYSRHSLLKLAIVLALIFIFGIGQVRGATTVTYTQSSTTAISVTNGTAPYGSSVAFSTTYTDKNQLISTKIQTLTLSGYDRVSISNITLSMKSNSSSGAGKLYYSTDNGKTWTFIIGGDSWGVKFNNSVWYGSWSTSYVDISKDVTINCSSSKVLIRIEATENSLYCQSFKLTYSVPSYTVAWEANGKNWTGVSHGSPSTSVDYNAKPSILPTAPISSDCDNSKIFVGWTNAPYSHASTAPTVLFSSIEGAPRITSNTTFYAVFANRSGSAKTYQFDITPSDFNGDRYASNTGGTTTATATDASGATMSVTWVSSNVMLGSEKIQIKKNSGYIYNSTDLGTVNSVTITKTNGTFSTWYGTSSNPTSGTQGSGKGYFTIKETGNSETGYASNIRVNFTKSNYTYSNYVTTCCTALGSINGSVSWTDATTAVVGWDNLNHVDSTWTVRYKTHAAGTWTNAFVEEVIDGSQTHIVVTDKSGSSSGANDSCYATITGLTACTDYDFRIVPTPDDGYCEDSATIEDSQTHRYTVTYELTNVSKTSGDTYTCAAEDFEAVFAADAGSALPATVSVTGASSHTWTQATGTLSIDDANITGDITITIVGVCSGFSLHTGTKSGSDWVYNKCFADVDWGATDDAIWEGEFPSTNEYYVGWQGGNSSYGGYWAVGGIKTYDIPTGRTLGWNSSDYYNDYPANALGTFHIYKNSTDGNYYLRFKPEAYVLRTGTDGTGWTSTAMTESASNSHYYETGFITLTEDLINEHAYVALKANNVNGYVWCNFSRDATAENNVKVKDSPGDADENFRNTNLADGDVGLYGKFRIDITKDANNWKLAFVPCYHVTYNGSGASGSTTASDYVEKGSTVSAASNGFTVPTGKTFAGWATSAENAAAGTVTYAAGASVTVNSNIELFAVWNWINYSVTVNKSGCAEATVGADKTTNVHYGETVTLSADEPDGYAFVDWTTEDEVTFSPNAATKGATFTMPASNVTVQANYHQIYTITWSVNGSALTGDDIASATNSVEEGDGITALPSAPADNTLNNCANKFVGWSVTDIGSTPVTDADDIAALGLFTDAAGSPTISKDTTFYAVFAERVGPAENTVIWSEDFTGATTGSAISKPTSNTIYSGSVNYSCVNGTSTNTYVVTGTYAGGSTPEMLIGASNGIFSALLLPSYAAAVLTLSYKQNGNKLTVQASGTGVTTISQNKNAAGTYTLDISCVKDNTFTLEFSAASSNVRLDDIVLKVKTPTYTNYVTQCAANQVRVTYDANGGSAPSCAGGVTTKNDSYEVCSTEPTRSYYDFGGWNDGSTTYAASASYDLQDNTTFTAQWTPTPYTITYELDGGTNDDDNPAGYNVETATITLKAPTRGQDRFEGWYRTYSEGVYTNQVTEIPLGSHGDTTLYAKWATRHTIVFDADGTKTTIYRADDEAINATVTGQGSKPANPSAPSTCSSKVFVGWSEDEIDGETDDEPTFADTTSTVDEDKYYYAVWATSTGTAIAAVEDDDSKFTSQHTASDTYCGINNKFASTDDYVQMQSIWISSQMTGVKVRIKVHHISNSVADVLRVSLINSSGTEVVGADLNTTAFGSGSDKAGYSSYVELTPTTAVTGYKVALKTKNSSGAAVDKVTREVVATRSAYATSCCATKVTLTQNDPEHGTVAFGKTTLPTCNGDKEVSLSITPAAGYQLTGWTVATGDGKVAPKSMSAAVVTNNNSNAAQNITLTFDEVADGDYDVEATFGEMTVSDWNWTMHDGGGAIPSRVDLYVGQSVRLDVAYLPAGLLSTHQIYARTKDDTYINWPGGVKPEAYCTFSGRASTGENTTTVTFTNAEGSLTQNVIVKVLPLPLVHFVDNVHNESFADVVATLTDNALTNSGVAQTPTHADFTGATANTCEETHLHLVGWIDGDWEAFAEYMDGTGDQPSESELLAATGYFYTPGADIDLVAKDGKTYYAVWAKIE